MSKFTPKNGHVNVSNHALNNVNLPNPWISVQEIHKQEKTWPSSCILLPSSRVTKYISPTNHPNRRTNPPCVGCRQSPAAYWLPDWAVPPRRAWEAGHDGTPSSGRWPCGICIPPVTPFLEGREGWIFCGKKNIGRFQSDLGKDVGFEKKEGRSFLVLKRFLYGNLSYDPWG